MLELKNISFSYFDRKVINNLSFSVPQGQNVAIMGESGCGKSTLLQLIYGLYDLESGSIHNNGTAILGPKFHLIPGEGAIKYLAQDFDLMPYITVEENVGKYLSNMFPQQKKRRVHELLDMVGMSDFKSIKAQFLSGGQQQRVALARVLALEPQILLLDEPFSQIDTFRKNQLRNSLFNYLKEKKITCLVATHDCEDVLSFSDTTIVMQNGAILAENSPQNMYENPSSHYIAALFGQVNEIKYNEITRWLYPHQLRMSSRPLFSVQVTNWYFKGAHYWIEAKLDTQTIYFQHHQPLAKAAIVGLEIKE